MIANTTAGSIFTTRIFLSHPIFNPMQKINTDPTSEILAIAESIMKFLRCEAESDIVPSIKKTGMHE